MDYAYSPVKNNNFIQRVIEPQKKIKIINGKRILKNDNNNLRIFRIKK